MIDLESKFEALEREVKEINTNRETLKKNLLDLVELHHILTKTQTFFLEVSGYYQSYAAYSVRPWHKLFHSSTAYLLLFSSHSISVWA